MIILEALAVYALLGVIFWAVLYTLDVIGPVEDATLREMAQGAVVMVLLWPFFAYHIAKDIHEDQG